MEYKTKRLLITGISLFLLFMLYIFKNFSLSIRILGTVFGLWVFYLFDHAFEEEFQLKHYFYVIIILIFGVLLSPLYFLSSNYDKILHLILPIFGSILIFFIVDKQKISFQWKIVITFMFIVSILAFHEIGEFILDKIWDLKLQGVYLRDMSGLEKYQLFLPLNDDTMIDMIFGIIGGGFFAIGKSLSYYYKKKFKKMR